MVEVLENTLNIAGWAEIENQSGTTSENARVKLIAGDVKRIIEEDDDYDSPNMRIYESMSLPDQQAEEKSFFDYHM